MQSGDIGLEQEKKVSKSVSQVNVLRQTYIRKRFQEINNALLLNNPEELKKAFLKIFTAEKEQVHDNFTKMSNEAAKNAIEKFFKNFS